MLGELTGVLEPLGKYKSDTWTLEMVREELTDLCDLDILNPTEKPTICQIRCADKGHYLRLANCACRPSAILVGMCISGRYRWVAKAARDILHGEEITINYGKRSLRGKSCLCIDYVHGNLDDVSAGKH